MNIFETRNTLFERLDDFAPYAPWYSFHIPVKTVNS